MADRPGVDGLEEIEPIDVYDEFLCQKIEKINEIIKKLNILINIANEESNLSYPSFSLSKYCSNEDVEYKMFKPTT